MSNPSSSAPAAILGPPKQFVLPRDNDLDVSFNGWLLECADDQLVRDKSGVTVCVYFTEGGSIVTQRIRWSIVKDRRIERHHVGVFDSANWSEAIEWFKTDNQGRFGAVSKEAWVRACQKLPQLKAYAIETVN
jgi:hypothetical protein